ncbi:MAG: DivIVA domain-containing protein [Bacteroidota bacterium]|nr:DivIVA domain-containing protein [Bacteroidota bacterium]
MKLTPLDIKKQEFKKVMRGYDPVEVNAFMEMIATEFTELLKENKDIKEQLIQNEVQIRDFRQMEKTLQQTLVQAQEASGKTIENARKEGQLVVQEAELKANQLLDQARADLLRMKEEIATLKSKRETIASRLRVLLNSELELIKALEIDDATSESSPDVSAKSTIDVDEIVKKL